MLYLCMQFYEGVMKRILLSLFFLLTWMGSAILADTPVTNGQGQTQKLTVFSSPDWSSSKYVPVVGYDANMYQKHEMIYPADYLQDMENCNISQMDFYTSDTKAQKVWTATFKVYLKEVAQSSFPSENITFTNFTDDDLVYTGQLDATGDIMSIVFDKSFFYQGGNLLVGIHLTQPGNYTTAFFLGKKMSYAREFQKIEDMLNNLNLDIPVYVVTINKTESEDIVVFDGNSTFEDKWNGTTQSLMPYSGRWINLGKSKDGYRFLLCNNTRYNQEDFNKMDGFPFPVKLNIACPNRNNKVDTPTINQLIDQVYQFSRIYWKSVKQQGLPVTIKYPEMIAEIMPHFEDRTIYTDNNCLWFL